MPPDPPPATLFDPIFFDSWVRERVSVLVEGGLVFDHVANHEPLVAEVGLRWVETSVSCIGG